MRVFTVVSLFRDPRRSRACTALTKSEEKERLLAVQCRCEGYGFQAVYSGVGYINQRVWVQDRVSFSRKLINWLPKSLGQGGFGEFSLVQGSKIQLNQLWYRLRVPGSQRHIPTQNFLKCPPGPLKGQHKAIFEAMDNQGITDFNPNET